MRFVAFFVLAGCQTAPDTMDSGPPDGGPWACPPMAPRAGDPCPPPLSCQYGPAGCGAFFQCSGTDAFSFRWQIVASDCPKLAACVPLVSGREAGTSCIDAGGAWTCDDYGLYCGCEYCDGGITWQCTPYHTPSESCPPTRPSFGSRCTAEGVVCDYRQCWSAQPAGVGPAARCLGGLWIADDSQCSGSDRPACR